MVKELGEGLTCFSSRLPTTLKTRPQVFISLWSQAFFASSLSYDHCCKHQSLHIYEYISFYTQSKITGVDQDAYSARSQAYVWILNKSVPCNILVAYKAHSQDMPLVVYLHMALQNRAIRCLCVHSSQWLHWLHHKASESKWWVTSPPPPRPPKCECIK